MDKHLQQYFFSVAFGLFSVLVLLLVIVLVLLVVGGTRMQEEDMLVAEEGRKGRCLEEYDCTGYTMCDLICKFCKSHEKYYSVDLLF